MKRAVALLAAVCLAGLVGALMGCGGTSVEQEDTGMVPSILELEADGVPSGATLFVRRPAADTWLDQDHPGATHGGNAVLKCSYCDGWYEVVLMRFNLRSLPTTTKVSKAYLCLHVADLYAYPAGALTCTIRRMTSSWRESDATWRSHGTAYDWKTEWSERVLDPTMKGKVVRFDVTALVQQWVTDPSQNYGCMVKCLGGAGESVSIGVPWYVVKFGSKEQSVASCRPRLKVYYAP